MTPARLDAAIEVLGQLSELASGMPEESEKAVAMALHLQLAQSYVVELRVHLANGLEPYDAMLRTMRGELPIPPDAIP